MKKYAINYSRTFPDHRVAPDFRINQDLMSGPSTYFRYLKNGFNAAGVKHFHVWLCFASAFAFGVAGLIKFNGHDARDTDINKRTFPGYKYTILSQRGGYGAYDNVLQRFEGEKGGLKDMPWDS